MAEAPPEQQARCVDLADPVKSICEALGIDPHYVARLWIDPTRATVELYRGKDGRCQGFKYVDPETDKPAMEWLDYRIVT